MGTEKRNWRFLPEDGFSVSLRAPVVILLVLFGIIPMLLCTQTMLRALRQSQTDARMTEVQNQGRILSSKMTRAGYLRGESKDGTLDNEIQTMADVYNGRIVVVNQDFRIVKDTFHIAERRFLVAEEVLRCFKGESSARYDREKNYFSQVLPIYDMAPVPGIEGVLVIVSSTEVIRSMMDTVSGRVIYLQLLVLVILLLAAFMAALVLVKPFRELQARLDRVAAGALDTDIHAGGYRETREISDAVDTALSRLKKMDQSRQEFVSNVSHELKTPITSIRVLADSLMSMEDAPVELYREFMEDISDEIDRENKIIDDLLELVRMDKARSGLNVTQVDIGLLVKQILKRLRPIANKRQVELILESIREVSADVDEMKMSLAVSNLVENAIKYNTPEGWVRVTVDADHKYFYIKVTDSGIGIPESLQTRIFERFYRVDKARSRETGGSGLGLSITREVVLLHRGSIQVSSQEGVGSTFTLQIPLNYIA